MSKKVLLGVVAALVVVVIALGAFILGGSGKNATVTIKDDTTKKTTTIKETPKQYQSLVSEIDKYYNADEKTVNVEELTDVMDENAPKGHTIVKITIVNKKGIELVKKAQDAINANNPSLEDGAVISAFQDQVHKYAQKLNNDTDVVEMGYDIAADQSQLIALSSKTKDIIPIFSFQ